MHHKNLIQPSLQEGSSRRRSGGEGGEESENEGVDELDDPGEDVTDEGKDVGGQRGCGVPDDSGYCVRLGGGLRGGFGFEAWVEGVDTEGLGVGTGTGVMWAWV